MPREASYTQQGHHARRIWIVRLVVFAAFLDLFMQFPVVAPYARQLGATPALVGVVVALYSVTNLVGNVAAGVVLDRWGRRLPILFGLVGTAIALIGYVLASTPQHLMLARSFHGLTAALLTPGAFAIIGDSASEKERARVMGISGAFIAAAAIVGPGVAGILRDRLGADAIFLLSATIMLGTAVLVWRMVKSTGPKDMRLVDAPRTNFVNLFRNSRLIASYLAVLALTVGLGTLVTHLPTVMADWGESSARTGLSFTAFAVVAMAGMATPLSRFSDRFGRIRPIVVSLILIAAGMAILAAANDYSRILAGMGVFGLGFGLLFPSATALASEAVTWEQRGKAFGVYYAVFSLGVVIGSVLSGLSAENAGISGMPFILSMAITLATGPAIVAVWCRRVSGGSGRSGSTGEKAANA